MRRRNTLRAILCSPRLVQRVRAADITDNSPMIWFFTRGSAQVDIEVRRVPDAELFELVIDYPDGSEGVERFRNPKKLVERTLAVQRRLIRSGWTPTSPGHHPRTQVAAPPKHTARRRRTLRAVPRVWAYVQKRVRERLAATFGF